MISTLFFYKKNLLVCASKKKLSCSPTCCGCCCDCCWGCSPWFSCCCCCCGCCCRRDFLLSSIDVRKTPSVTEDGNEVEDPSSCVLCCCCWMDVWLDLGLSITTFCININGIKTKTMQKIVVKNFDGLTWDLTLNKDWYLTS